MCSCNYVQPYLYQANVLEDVFRSLSKSNNIPQLNYLLKVKVLLSKFNFSKSIGNRMYLKVHKKKKYSLCRMDPISVILHK